jgi:ubiquinone/menaquinone biosynthesis C-methylase UbiE
MQESEFDKFADEYQKMHAANITASGEGPEFFARYKIEDVRTKLAERALEDLHVLDFGAGVGTSIPHFETLLPKARLTCLDVSRKSLDLARRRYPDKADFVVFDGHTLPFPDNSFDLVFSACVFHHIPHAEHLALLEELRRVLKTGGSCVIFEHNPLNPLTLQAVNTCPFDENAVLIKATDFNQRFRQAGFAEVGHYFRIFFPRVLRQLRFLEPHLTWLPLGAQYYVSGRK